LDFDDRNVKSRVIEGAEYEDDNHFAIDLGFGHEICKF
jgi:hypothetical protein